MAGSSEKHFELHEYEFDRKTIEGQPERVRFSLRTALIAHKGDLRAVRALVKDELKALGEDFDWRQYRLTQRIQCFDATPKPNYHKVAMIMEGPDATKHEIDAARQDVKLAVQERDAGLLTPSPITSGSSVNFPPPPLEKTPPK
ncbi:hypothetical protein [Bradyrhizobium sp. SZCCHNRI2010]|uniref:hypothetical protein n=1 Tax=Bradyrhizobium sp. SZCCHNRI2010 TaxID=3057283 RepID=UPI0028E35607|nr:hypothetical protein [Bradyrhizobium sp. SZCCHNRI2010]